MLAFRSLGWVETAVGTAYSRVILAAYEAGSLQAWLDFMNPAPPDLDHGATPTLIVYGQSSGPGVTRFEAAQAQAVAAKAGQLVRLDNVAELPWHSETSQETALNAILRFTDSLGSTTDPHTAQMPGFRTLLFTDLESSTQLTQQLGDAKAQDLLEGHNDAVRTALTDHGGDEVKHTGDGIFGAFTSAVSAVEASLQIQRDLAGAEVKVRIGLNAGEPIAQDDDYFGAAVQLAARVCDRAEPGQILVAQVVRDLCRGKDFRFDDQGEATLKGFPDPVRLFVVGPSA